MTTTDSTAAGHALALFITEAAFREVNERQADPFAVGSAILAAGIAVLGSYCGREQLVRSLEAAAEHAAQAEVPSFDA